MLRKAEEMKKEDEENLAKINAKNGLESYAYQMRNTLEDPNVGGKLSTDDKESLKKAVDDAIHWLDNNPDATKEEYERRQKDLESIANPIISKMYQGGGGGGMPDMGASSGATGESTSQPKFEDLDVD